MEEEGVSSTQAETYAHWESDGWTRVRHIPQRDFWYEGDDNLEGTDVRGDPNNNTASWSIDFEEAVPEFDEVLFSSGTRSKWLMVTKEASISWFYSNSARQILKSSISETPYVIHGSPGQQSDRRHHIASYGVSLIEDFKI